MPLSEDVVRELKQSVEIRQMHGTRSPTSLEWWYFTGHLAKNSDQKPCPRDIFSKKSPDFAVQSTFFLSDQASPKGLLAHAAESDLKEKQHRHMELVSTLSSSKLQSPIAYAEKYLLNLALGHWRLTQLGSSEQTVHWDLRFDVKGSEYLLQLDVPKNRIWFHGRDGYLQKTPSTGNFYYSIPMIQVRGLRMERQPGSALTSQPVCGQLWFDHEIHVEKVLEVGWTWFGLSFSNQKALMIYDIHSGDKKDQSTGGEIWDQLTGRSGQLKNVKIEPSTPTCLQSGRCYPLSFNISFVNPFNNQPERVEARAAFAEQELGGAGSAQSRVYWEGSTSARWVASGRTEVAEGIGFTEQVPQVSKK